MLEPVRKRVPPVRRVFWWLLATGAAAFLLTALVITLNGFHDDASYGDVAVVLGNQVYPDGQPSPRLVARMDRALQLYREQKCGVILVSGGVDPNGQDEAKVMAAYLRWKGVPADRLLEDNGGVDTFHTAQNTRRLLREHHWRSVCVVTQYFHIARSRYAMKRSGISPVYSVHARYFEWGDPLSICREVAGFGKYTLRSYPNN